MGGYSCLHLAVVSGIPELVELLIDHGAEREAVTSVSIKTRTAESVNLGFASTSFLFWLLASAFFLT